MSLSSGYELAETIRIAITPKTSKTIVTIEGIRSVRTNTLIFLTPIRQSVTIPWCLSRIVVGIKTLARIGLSVVTTNPNTVSMMGTTTVTRTTSSIIPTLPQIAKFRTR